MEARAKMSGMSGRSYLLLLCASISVMSLSSVESMVCPPNSAGSTSDQPPKQLGELCGGFCGKEGVCADGLHCDVGLFAMRAIPMGVALKSRCRNATVDAIKFCHHDCPDTELSVFSRSSSGPALDVMPREGDFETVTEALNSPAFQAAIQKFFVTSNYGRILCAESVDSERTSGDVKEYQVTLEGTINSRKEYLRAAIVVNKATGHIDIEDVAVVDSQGCISHTL